MTQQTSEAETALHVALIMDGNGRWATSRGLERLKGHVKGVDRVREIVRAAPDYGISHITLFAFSTENWKRSEKEVTGLMNMFRRYIRGEAEALDRENVKVRFIGDRSRLDRKLQDLMHELEKLTENNTKLNMTIALNYGGRDEIVRATQKIARAVKIGMLAPEDVTEETVSKMLDTAEIPDPDLVIRTSGESRTSNFLLWQASYAEYVFTDTEWPDFKVAELVKTLNEFKNRERRFGATGTE